MVRPLGGASFVIVFACFAGCTSLAPLPEAPKSGPPEFAGKVILFRDTAATLSFGMDTLAKRLREIGLQTEVDFHPQWRLIAGRVAKERENNSTPLVLVGHSFGADAALRLAHKLDERDLPVDLVVAIDPVSPPRVPKNVRRALNIYRREGVLDGVPLWHGVALSVEANAGGVELDNINVVERPDLNFVGLHHGNIDDNPIIQQEVIRQILKVCKRVDPLSS